MKKSGVSESSIRKKMDLTGREVQTYGRREFSVEFTVEKTLLYVRGTGYHPHT